MRGSLFRVRTNLQSLSDGKSRRRADVEGQPPRLSNTPEAMSAPASDSPLDQGVRPYVEALHDAGIETFESCEGGEGHAYPEPTVRFHGSRAEGFRALTVALQHNLPVLSLRRAWPIIDGEPTGPWWELAFYEVSVPES